MNTNCRVSVLVTFYNQKNSVSRALGSVLAQKTSFPFEIIVGDDGSEDGTWEEIQAWAQKHPEVIFAYQMDRNDGVTGAIARASHNRLALTKQSKGDYLVYLDGDDYFPDTSKLEKQLSVLDADASLASCTHNFEYVSPDGDRLATPFPERSCSIRMSFSDYWRSCYLPASSFMFRRPVEPFFCKVDFDNYDDNSIIFPLAHSGDVCYLGNVMFSYVQQEGSTWNDMTPVERVLVNQKDFYFEREYALSCISAIQVRHGLEFLRLALFSKPQLLAHVEKANSLGLLNCKSFAETWEDLTSDKALKRTVRRLKLLGSGISQGMKRIFSFAKTSIRLRVAKR